MLDLIKQTSVALALLDASSEKTDKRTGRSYLAWNQQKASLVLGITHKQLQATIKQAGLEEPLPGSDQGDFFGNVTEFKGRIG